MIVLTNTIHLSESTVVICLSKMTWLAQNLYGSLFLQIGDFLCFVGTNFWVTDGFFLLWMVIFAILNKLQTNHIFMFIEYVEWIIHIFKQYFGVCILYKASKPGYFSL